MVQQARAAALVMASGIFGCSPTPAALAPPPPTTTASAQAPTAAPTSLPVPETFAAVSQDILTRDERFLGAVFKSSVSGKETIGIVPLDGPERGHVTKRVFEAADVAVRPGPGDHQLLVFDVAGNNDALLDAATGEVTPIGDAGSNIEVVGDRILLVSKTGVTEVIDPATGARTSLKHTPFSKGDAIIEVKGGGLAAVSASDRTLLVQVSPPEVKLEVTGEILVKAVSSTGRYLAGFLSDSRGTVAVLHDTMQKKEIYSEKIVAAYPGGMTVSPQETWFAAELIPGSLTLVALPGGKRSKKSLRLDLTTEGYGSFHDALQVTADDEVLCAHESTTIGKYTTCEVSHLVSLKPGRKPGKPNHLTYCFFGAQHAFLAHVPSAKALLGGFTPLLSTSATYTHICTPTISPDGTRLAMERGPTRPPPSEEKAPRDLQIYDLTRGALLTTLTLDPSFQGMGEAFSAGFSPDNALVLLDDGTRVIDIASGKDLPAGQLSPGGRFILGEGWLFDRTTGTKIELEHHKKQP